MSKNLLLGFIVIALLASIVGAAFWYLNPGIRSAQTGELAGPESQLDSQTYPVGSTQNDTPLEEPSQDTSLTTLEAELDATTIESEDFSDL